MSCDASFPSRKPANGRGRWPLSAARSESTPDQSPVETVAGRARALDPLAEHDDLTTRRLEVRGGSAALPSLLPSEAVSAVHMPAESRPKRRFGLMTACVAAGIPGLGNAAVVLRPQPVAPPRIEFFDGRHRRGRRSPTFRPGQRRVARQAAHRVQRTPPACRPSRDRTVSSGRGAAPAWAPTSCPDVWRTATSPSPLLEPERFSPASSEPTSPWPCAGLSSRPRRAGA